METSVTFTANSQTGNIPRISSAVKKLGFKSTNIKLLRKPEESLDLITMIVDAQRHLLSGDFASIVAKVDSVVKVEVGHQEAVVAKAGGASAKAASTRRPSARASSAPVSADDEIAIIVKDEGRKLAGVYPDIWEPLVGLESTMDPTLRPALMKKMGYALGQWQYKKNYEQGGRLNSTVQRSLSMQKASFNGLPVIADLMSKGATKETEMRNEDPMVQIERVLSDFLTVSMDGSTISVTDCPHCSAERSPARPDCHFVNEFIKGFMLDNSELKGKSSKQLASKATGGDACIFEIA